MLMKLTPGVNFTNILQAAFSCESVMSSFSVLKEIGEKAARKILVKLIIASLLKIRLGLRLTN